MSVNWQALLDKQIAVVCHSQEECEAFLFEAVRQHIPMQRIWLKDIRAAAERHWENVEDSPWDWYGVVYGISYYDDLGFCWPSWWKGRGYTLVNFDDADVFADCTVEDLI